MRDANTGKKILWLYFDNLHTDNPILCQAAGTLAQRGFRVYVLDGDVQKVNSIYHHYAIGFRLFSKTYTTKSLINTNQPSELKESGFHILLILYRPLYNIILFIKALYYSLKIRPEYIVFSKPTLSGLTALVSSIILRSRLVYYPFELYGEQHVDVPVIWKKFEMLLLQKYIVALITQNHAREKVYLKSRKSRVKAFIVHNYKLSQEILTKGKLHNLLKLSGKQRLVIYEGYLTYGRCLLNLIRSSKYLSENATLVFIGKALPWWKKHAVHLLLKKTYNRKIRVLPWIPGKKLLENIKDACVGIIIYDNTKLNNYYCEPGKLSDYIISGIPVVVPNFPTIAPVVKKYSIGGVFNSSAPKEIAEAINKVICTPRKYWRENLKRAKKDLIWETQIPNLLKAFSTETSTI